MAFERIYDFYRGKKLEEKLNLIDMVSWISTHLCGVGYFTEASCSSLKAESSLDGIRRKRYF